MRPQCLGHDLNLTRKIEVVVINNDEIVDVTMMFRYVTVDYIFYIFTSESSENLYICPFPLL